MNGFPTTHATSTSLTAIQIPVLTDNNSFPVWLNAIKIHLRAHGLSGYVEGIVREPSRGADEERTSRAGTVPPDSVEGRTITDVEARRWQQWADKENAAQATLLQTVGEGLRMALEDLDSAHAMWERIATTHRIDTVVERAKLNRKIDQLRLRDGATADDMRRHLESYYKLLHTAKVMGITHEAGEDAARFMATLPKSMRSLVRQFEVLPVLERTMETVDRVWNDEITYERDTETINAPAAFVVRPVRSPTRSRVPDRPIGRFGGPRPMKDMSKVDCYNCGKYGHMAKECRSRPIKAGRARDQKPAETSKPTGRISTGFVGLTKAEDVPERFESDVMYTGVEGNEWVIDSGATHHLTPSYELLKDVRVLEEPLTFSLADKGSSITAREVGSYVFKLSAGQTVTLQDVYYVPQAKASIISVGTMTRKGWMFEMTASGSSIYQRGAHIGLERSRGMWVAKLRSPEGPTGTIMEVVAPVIYRSPLEEEHQRLGHLGRAKLLEIARAGGTKHDVKDLEKDNFKLTDCRHCQAHKTTRPPKNDESPRGMLHVDLGGPFDKSAEGNDTMLVAVDDRTRARFVVPMNGKTHALDQVKRIVAKLDRQGSEKVKVVRSDGGGEFGSNEAKRWYDELGLLHQISPRYTPELNGVAERNMRTIKEMIATMISSSTVGHRYWDYAARYAAAILNKTTTSGTDVNPWEVLTGRSPNIQSIRRFGEPCFVQVPRGTRNKATFEVAKALKGYILGQDEQVSGWIVLTEDGSVERSRDVRELTGMIPEASAYIEPIEEAQEEVIELGPTVSEDHESDNTDVPEAFPGDDRPADQPQEGGGVYRPGNWEYQLGGERRVIPEGDTNLQRGDRHRRPPNRFEGGLHLVEGLEWHGQGARSAYLAAEAAVFVAELETDDPRTFENSVRGVDGLKWIDAMNAEIENIESKGTWEEAELPEGRSAIGCKWVYKKKKDQEGKVIKYKARLVAKGYSQVPGIDYEETFAPVGRSTSLRMLLAISASEDFETGQADVEGAYLNGVLEEELYMEIPKGLTPKRTGCNCLKLSKSLYGLKQSGRTWWTELGEGLEEQGFDRTESDWGLYYRSATETHEAALLLAYVDDIVVAARSRSTITAVFAGMAKRWKITVLDEVSHILGLKVVRDRLTRTMHLSQAAYIESVVSRFPAVKPKTTPLGYRKTEEVSTDDGDEAVGLTGYQAIVGSLLWVAGCTRPDVSFAAGFLARHTAAPRQSHWDLAITCLAYLAATKDAGLVLGGRKGLNLEGWVDADHAGCLETRRSTTGYVFKLGDSPIVWRSTRQSTVSKSTVEAEYVAASEATAEARWLRTVLATIGYPQERTVLWVDNQGAIKLANNPSTHQRTKHIDIKYHFIRKAILDDEIILNYVHTGQQQADMLTKGLPGPRHAENTHELGLRRPGGARVLSSGRKGSGSEDGFSGVVDQIRANEMSIDKDGRGDYGAEEIRPLAQTIREQDGFDGMTKRPVELVARMYPHQNHSRTPRLRQDDRTSRGDTIGRQAKVNKAEYQREMESRRGKREGKRG